MLNAADRERTLLTALQQMQQARRDNGYPDLAWRLHHLTQISRFMTDQHRDLVRAVQQDYGHRSSHETELLEIGPVLAGVQHARRHLADWMRARPRPVDRLTFGFASNRVMPQPLGVVGILVPWNFPINLSWLPLVGVLSAGNTAMVKLSEHSPAMSALLVERVPQYFGDDVIRFLEDDGHVGPVFSGLPFDHLLFTGSAATGRKVMAAAASHLTPLTLELGGKSPAVIDTDADIAAAARRIMQIKCLNAGQMCVSVDHVWCPASRVDDFVDAARQWVKSAYGRLDSPDYTSIIHAGAYRRLCSELDQAQARGAWVECLLDGAARDDTGHRLAPHVVRNLPADSALLRDEIFGPILPVLPYDDDAQWRQALGRSAVPLALYPFSRRRAWVRRLLREIPSGGVCINDAMLQVGQEDLPFGGQGQSGFGHYHGRDGFVNFSKMRPVHRSGPWSPMALLQPPYTVWTDRLLAFMRRRAR
jgi:coniferyl-aldehyde dehydrogenase